LVAVGGRARVVAAVVEVAAVSEEGSKYGSFQPEKA
jgi:hypothetical protein